MWSIFYILKGREAVQIPMIDEHGVYHPELLAWARKKAGGVEAVAQEHIGPFWLSTVFLGYDASHGGIFGEAAPLLFETMIFSDEDDLTFFVRGREFLLTAPPDIPERRRYPTYDAAEEGHASFRRALRRALGRHVRKMRRGAPTWFYEI